MNSMFNIKSEILLCSLSSHISPLIPLELSFNSTGFWVGSWLFLVQNFSCQCGGLTQNIPYRLNWGLNSF